MEVLKYLVITKCNAFLILFESCLNAIFKLLFKVVKVKSFNQLSKVVAFETYYDVIQGYYCQRVIQPQCPRITLTLKYSWHFCS